MSVGITWLLSAIECSVPLSFYDIHLSFCSHTQYLVSEFWRQRDVLGFANPPSSLPLLRFYFIFTRYRSWALLSSHSLNFLCLEDIQLQSSTEIIFRNINKIVIEHIVLQFICLCLYLTQE